MLSGYQEDSYGEYSRRRTQFAFRNEYGKDPASPDLATI